MEPDSMSWLWRTVAVCNTNCSLEKQRLGPASSKRPIFNRQMLDDVVDFGLSSSDWMKQALPRALAPTTLTIVINASDPNANANVRGDQLPLAPSVAADLLLTAIVTSGRYINWGKISRWTEDAIASKSFPTSPTQPTRYVAAAPTVGLLPPGAAASETAQRDWFVRQSGAYVGHHLWDATGLMASTDIPMHFTRVQITPTVTFDAVTITLTVDAKNMPPSFWNADKTTRYTALSPQQRVISPTHVFVPKFGKRFVDFNIDCAATSNTLLLLLTTTKRLEADALVDNMTVNNTGLYRGGTELAGVVENLRLVYTLTVGRLSWKLQDLAESGRQGAVAVAARGRRGRAAARPCAVHQVRLLVRQRLVARAAARHDHPANNADLATTVIQSANSTWNVGVGDLLFPHNIKTLSVNTSRGRLVQACSSLQEDRQHVVVHNHAYIEHPLQATYTAATVFLFKNGVVRDVLSPTNARTASPIQSLALDGNVQLMKIVASVPDQNAMITIAGCVLLLCGLTAVLVMSSGGLDDPFENIRTPQVIARVLLDDQHFPSLLLHRRVAVDGSVGDDGGEDADQFVIQSLTLQKPKDASATRADAFGINV